VRDEPAQHAMAQKLGDKLGIEVVTVPMGDQEEILSA